MVVRVVVMAVAIKVVIEEQSDDSGDYHGATGKPRSREMMMSSNHGSAAERMRVRTKRAPEMVKSHTVTLSHTGGRCQTDLFLLRCFLVLIVSFVPVVNNVMCVAISYL